MPITTFAKRYAQAVFEIAQEKNELEKWHADLIKTAEITQDSKFIDLVENPKLGFELKAELVKEKLGKINPLVLNLAYLLIMKGRLKHTGQIADEYQRLLDDYRGIKHAEVTTAVPLDDADKKKLSQRLESIVGKKVSVTLQVDPDIIGGIIARIDGSLVDGSVRHKLEILKKSMSETRR